MRRAFFFIVAVCLATSSFASIPRASMLDASSTLRASLPETRIRVFDVVTPFAQPHQSGLTRALRQAYEQSCTTNASGLSRFLTTDPLPGRTAEPQSWNRYSYVRNGPVNRLDRTGLSDVTNTFTCSDMSGGRPCVATSTVIAKDPGWLSALWFDAGLKIVLRQMGRNFTEAEVAAMMGQSSRASYLMLGGKVPHIIGGPVLIGPISVGRSITFANGFWQAEGSSVKFSDYYYTELRERYGAPFLAAQEVLDTATDIGPDPLTRPGFFRYSNGVNEIVYNPSTGEVWHFQPIK